MYYRLETEEEEARRLFPGDFITEDEEDWCFRCYNYNCRCLENEEEERLREQKREMAYLSCEALEEDHEHTLEAQQAKWGAEQKLFETEHENWLEEYLKDYPWTWRDSLEPWWQKIKHILWH